MNALINKHSTNTALNTFKRTYMLKFRVQSIDL